jgi:hypothetical protein
MRLWDPPPGAEPGGELVGGHEGAVRALAVLADGRVLVSGELGICRGPSA